MSESEENKNMLIMYKGRPVTELSKDELLEALKTCYTMHLQEREFNRRILSMNDVFDNARKRMEP